MHNYLPTSYCFISAVYEMWIWKYFSSLLLTIMSSFKDTHKKKKNPWQSWLWISPFLIQKKYAHFCHPFVYCFVAARQGMTQKKKMPNRNSPCIGNVSLFSFQDQGIFAAWPYVFARKRGSSSGGFPNESFLSLLLLGLLLRVWVSEGQVQSKSRGGLHKKPFCYPFLC